MKFINQLQDGDKICQVFLVSSVNKGVTTTGAIYLNLNFIDKTGVLEARKWDATQACQQTFKVNNYVYIDGEVIKYRNGIQLKIIDYRLIDPDLEAINYQDYIQVAPIAKDRLIAELEKFIASIENQQIRDLVNKLVSDNFADFTNMPAGIKIHHAYLNGLLHHVVSMLKLAETITSIYPVINADLVYAGIILHDLGKIVELSSQANPKYSLEGRLLGHISIGHAMLKQAGDALNIDHELLVLLEHILLAHHGKLEQGSPVAPAIIEAEVVALIDNLDAEINSLEKVLDGVAIGEFTNRLFHLQDRSFYRHKLSKKN